MTKGYWARVIMMLGVLAAVVFVMRRLNQPQHPVDILGAATTGSLSAVNLCPTRILWLETPHGSMHIEEEGTRWIRLMSGDQKQLDTIAVEKWFSKFCMADVEIAESKETFEPILKIGYLGHKQNENLSESPSGVYELRGQHFKSKNLKEVLLTLPVLPLETKPGTQTETPASH